MKKQNTCHVYNFVFKKIQEIYVLRKIEKNLRNLALKRLKHKR